MSEVSVQLSFAAVADIVAQVSDSLLSCSVQEVAQMAGKDAIDRASSCVYAITLSHATGTFDIVSACHPSDAHRLAGQMTGKAGPSLTPNLIGDALSEWLNIIAGQIKSLAGLDHTMGLPRTVDMQNGSAPEGIYQAQGIRIELSGIEVVLWLGLVGGPDVTLVLGG